MRLALILFGFGLVAAVVVGVYALRCALAAVTEAEDDPRPPPPPPVERVTPLGEGFRIVPRPRRRP